MNNIVTNFSQWMRITTGLSDSSIYKYSRAVISVSKDMCSIGVISKPLTEMNTIELDLAIQIILNNAVFIEKNTRGNNMYSNSLKQFRSYRITTEEVDTLNQRSNAKVNATEGTKMLHLPLHKIAKNRE